MRLYCASAFASKMMSSCYVYLLCLLFCCWSVSETLGTNPVRLSQVGLNYAARVAVQRLVAKMREASFPDQSGQRNIVIGEVKYEVKNIKVGV